MFKYILFPFIMIYMSVICPLMAIFNVFTNTKKSLLFNLCNYVNLIFNVKIIRVSENDIVRNKDIIYLTNHRSFADMFIDPMIIGYSGMFIARNLVALVFPFSFIVSRLTNNCIYINRENIGNIVKFFKIVEDTRKKYSHLNIIVYPEGTRRPNSHLPCPLKKGFIYHSYNNNLPLQIFISNGKEKVINESKFTFNTGQTVLVSFSNVISPNKDIETIEEYLARVQLIWNSTWMQTFSIKEKNYKTYPFDQNSIFKNKYRKTNKLYWYHRLSVYAIWTLSILLLLFLLS